MAMVVIAELRKVEISWSHCPDLEYFPLEPAHLDKQVAIPAGGPDLLCAQSSEGMSDLSLRSQLGSFHANIISIASVTGTNTSLPGNLNIQGSANVVGSITAATASITGSLMVAGTNVTGGGLADYQYGSLNMRVFDDTAVYARATLTSGGALPAPFLSRPVGDTPFSTLSFSQAVFGTSLSAYSARVSGYVNPPYSGTYLFRTTFQDGATLYIGLQKVCDSWTYVGSALQSIGTVTLAQNVWQPLVLEHTASSTLTERLLVEFSTNSGSVYTTMAHGTGSSQFQMAYNVKETPTALHGSSYASGRAYFADVASFNSALSLRNATSFTGRTSELTNDAGYILSGTNLSLTCQNLVAGTVTLSNIQPPSSVTGVVIGNALFAGSTQQSYTNVSTAGNVTYTPSQVVGGIMLRNAGSNGSYTDTLPSAASLFTACNGIVGATFTFTMYPAYSITIATGSGGSIYAGLLGNSASGFSSYSGASLTQGGSSILVPNNATYLFSFVMTSATTYTVFIK